MNGLNVTLETLKTGIFFIFLKQIIMGIAINSDLNLAQNHNRFIKKSERSVVLSS